MKIAVVTGASTGMGREFVRQISRKYNSIEEIWVIARSEDKLRKLKRVVKGIAIRVIPLDLTKPESFDRYQKLLEEHNPEIRVLVNAAGFGVIGTVDEISLEDNVGMIELNCVALTRMTKISLPYMCKKKSNIINLASAAAFLPQPKFAVYAASKAYVYSFSTALQEELKFTNTAVTSVCPGPVNTRFFDIAEKHHEIATYKRFFKANPRKVVAKALRDAYLSNHVSIYGFTIKSIRFLSKLVPYSLAVKFVK